MAKECSVAKDKVMRFRCLDCGGEYPAIQHCIDHAGRGHIYVAGIDNMDTAADALSELV